MVTIKTMGRTKQGAASFYMVAITTLVLVIIATSFAAIMVAEIARTSNDDLAQSAYDAAMAGVEDAKLAYYSYTNCMKSGGSGCEGYLGNSDGCNTFVGKLGRGENGKEVKVQEGSENNMEQAYTCVKISPILGDYKADMNGENPTKIVKVELADGVNINNIDSVEISWGFENSDKSINDLPKLEVSLIQTASTFTMEDFAMTKEEQTNRGTVFLEPVSAGGVNEISAEEGFLKSNNKVASNGYHDVKYEGDTGKCSVKIGLPEPVGGGDRSPKTFMFVWSLLGNVEDTVTVTMKLFCSESCGGDSEIVDENIDGDPPHAMLNMQVGIDSTGRANDLYRRVGVRLEKEPADAQRIYALMAENIKKEYATCENNFIETPNCE